MAASNSGSKSLKEYLKRYESNEQEKKKKKKKKTNKPVAPAVLVVDEDPVWQKPVNLEEDNDDDSPDEKPVVDEDIEVRRMKRLEQLRLRRPYGAISEDGSGWVSLSSNNPSSSNSNNFDLSPSCRQRIRNDTPSPEPERNYLRSGREDNDLSPPRQRKRNDSPSPEPDTKLTHSADISPPRRRRTRNDTPSPEPELKSERENMDLSPPRQRRKRYHSPSPEPDRKPLHPTGMNSDISPPRRSRPRKSEDLPDISPPRRARRDSPYHDDKRASPELDLSPPRKSRTGVGRRGLSDLSPQHSHKLSSKNDSSRASLMSDLSPPRKNQKELFVPASSKDRPKTGLITGRDMQEEITRTKKDDWLRFQEMDPSMSGRGAEPVYRDKKGERISKEEYLKSKQKKEEKPKEKKLEWGKGLAQKREAEARQQELELEKEKPFARTRDDPELDNMLKERLRWGDPMAHLVKKKHTELVPADLGDNEKMKESGFIIPQDIPIHSWIKRGLDAAPNRYDIRPGRHWDGVDRSNGFEKTMFKRKNEKQATEREAYLWSVADM